MARRNVGKTLALIRIACDDSVNPQDMPRGLGIFDLMPLPSGDSPTSGGTSARHVVTQAVPFFNVTDIETSILFYADGLGFVLTNQ